MVAPAFDPLKIAGAFAGRVLNGAMETGLYINTRAKIAELSIYKEFKAEAFNWVIK